MTLGEASGAPFNEQQRWTAVAPAWERWAESLAPMADQFNQPLLDAVGVSAGDRALDLACGAGEPALSLARRVGPQGSAAALDLAPAMAEATRRRAAAQGVRVTTLAGDMEALPFRAESFDRATCRFGLMFCPDPIRALREVNRVLRSGGCLGLAVWGPRADNTLFAVLGEAAEQVFGPPYPAMSNPFRFADAGRLESLLLEAQFGMTSERELRFTRRVALEPKPGKSPFWQATFEMLPGFGADAAPKARQAMIEAIKSGFDARREGDAVNLDVTIRIGTGQRVR